MSRRYWVAAIALTVILSFGSAYWAFSSLSKYKKEHARERETVASYSQENYQEFSRRCTGMPDAISQLACLLKSVDAHRGAQRAKYDLKAQQDMAEFAFAVLIASLAGVVISLVGVVFVATTLQAAVEANTQTRNIFLSETRPWLRIKRTKLIHAHFEGTDMRYLEIKVDNIGEGHAININYHAKSVENILQTIGNVFLERFAKSCNSPALWGAPSYFL